VIKRVNSTGRKRIASEHVRIIVHDDTSPRTFDAEIDLSDFSAPSDAVVVIEAMCARSNVVSRFEWGSVGELVPPLRRDLTGLTGKSIFFSLKVIDRSQRFGRILGIAENLRPLLTSASNQTGRQGILPIEERDLGQRIWRLEFEGEHVVLVVNSRLPNFAHHLRSDPQVFGMIYPIVLEQVLKAAIESQPDTDDDLDPQGWPSRWLKFGRQIHPQHLAAPEAASDEYNEWVEGIVDEFCNQYRFCDKLIAIEDNLDCVGVN